MAWEILGVDASSWADLRAHPLPRDYVAVDIVARWLTEFRPDVVFVPHPGEADRDHAAVADIVADAMAAAGHWTTMLGYEVWTPIAQSTLLEDVGPFIETKRRAIRAYSSQLADRPYDEAAVSLARFRGVMSADCAHAEAFMVAHR